jgi:hypothetical protein
MLSAYDRRGRRGVAVWLVVLLVAAALVAGLLVGLLTAHRL